MSVYGVVAERKKHAPFGCDKASGFRRSAIGGDIMHTYQILVIFVWILMAAAVIAGVVGIIRAIRRR
jgi:hypothetical protein